MIIHMRRMVKRMRTNSRWDRRWRSQRNINRWSRKVIIRCLLGLRRYKCRIVIRRIRWSISKRTMKCVRRNIIAITRIRWNVWKRIYVWRRNILNGMKQIIRTWRNNGSLGQGLCLNIRRCLGILPRLRNQSCLFLLVGGRRSCPRVMREALSPPCLLIIQMIRRSLHCRPNICVRNGRGMNRK